MQNVFGKGCHYYVTIHINLGMPKSKNKTKTTSKHNSIFIRSISKYEHDKVKRINVMYGTACP